MTETLAIPAPRLPIRAEPWPSSPATTCPVCGKWWQPWRGSRLPCHAACLYDDVNLARLREIAAHAETRLAELARLQGISLATLNGVLRSER